MYTLDLLEISRSSIKTIYSEEMPGTVAAALKNLEVFNGGKVLTPEPLVVDLSTNLWATCARFSFNLTNSTNIEQELQIELCVEALAGCVQILAVDQNNQDLASLQRMSPESRITTYRFSTKNASQCHISFSNATLDNRACKIRIACIRVIAAHSAQHHDERASAGYEDFNIDNLFSSLEKKWQEVPAADQRQRPAELLTLPDHELKTFWEQKHRLDTTGAGFAHRGWYQDLYRDRLANKRVADIGSGMGLDGIHFARHGAKLTFVDLSESNLELIRRLCAIFSIETARFVLLENFSSFEKLEEYDFIWCQGSMINAPSEIMAIECRHILEHLPVGGHWIELAYPRARWLREGSVPFNTWGRFTDGENTPWMEWYDIDKLLHRLAPARFDTLLNFNFYDDNFNWFELRRTG